MLYWRTDLLNHPPASLDELVRQAETVDGTGGVTMGFVWQGARYEGLVTVFLEVLGGFGGAILGSSGRVTVDAEPGVRALSFLRDALQATRISPPAVLAWQEEQVRFAFQNGSAVFMRNWPYAFPLMEDSSQSRIAGRFAVAPMPAGPGGAPTAALGGSQLAINAHSRHPDLAYALIAYLTDRPRCSSVPWSRDSTPPGPRCMVIQRFAGPSRFHRNRYGPWWSAPSLAR
jgi:multiple sugar transport system substrate-binding protein